MKRFLDLAGAGLGLIVLGPLLALVALVVRVGIGRPVLFVQPRPGLGGRAFRMVKFRTMSGARDQSGNLLPDAQRLTALGRFLRKCSVDELPELWNVLRGDMSLVGPRPLLPQYLARYSAFQRRRHDVRPGITGWAQVNGRNALTWESRFELDVWYVNHQSLWLDLRILWTTFLKVLRREGVSQPGNATMSEFMGTVE